jgi:anti-sigma regulatory factor (Ser/Thr protein kinase)
MVGIFYLFAFPHQITNMRQREELPRAVEAPGHARRLLAAWAGDELAPDELDRAKLVCSELVNNAILHGTGKVELRLDLDEDRLLIEIIDEGQGFEHVVREVPFEELSGRGLSIVEAEASRWGVHEGTTHVWAELDRAPGGVGGDVTSVWAELERPGPRVGEEAKPGADD